MDTDLIEILKYILLAVSAILIITLLISFIVSKFRSDSNNDVDAGNLIKSPEPKIVRASSKRGQEKTYRHSDNHKKSHSNSSHYSQEKRSRGNNNEYSKEKKPRNTHEEKSRVTRTTGTNGQNKPRMQVLTDLKNPNKKNIQDQYLGGGY